MRIDLEKDEAIELVIDGTCEFIVVGERDEEGTMIISWGRKNEGFPKPSLCEQPKGKKVITIRGDKFRNKIPKSKGCGKEVDCYGHPNINVNGKWNCGDNYLDKEIILCLECRKKSEGER